jgi:type II secretory pathway pseudopilin PulG
MMPSVQSSNFGGNFQHGGALLVMLVILVMGITTVFVTSLSGTAIQNHRNHSSAEALAKAKEALIGYAVTYGDINLAKSHGYLPCPDDDGSSGANSEGSSEACGDTDVSKLGRLPWRTLDLPALFDGASECLWYAVSGNYKSTRSSPPLLNWDNPGQLHVYDIDGVTEINPGEIVAVVIAPGAPLSSNTDRAGNNAPTCGGNYTPSAYLENDTVHSINNADVSQGKFILPHKDSDTVSTNDQIVFITRQDIWNGIQKRIARQAKKCLDDYAATVVPPNTTPSNKYPWAVPLSDATAAPGRTGTPNVRFGRFPDVPNISISGGTGTCPSSSSPLSSFSAAQISALNDAIQQVQDALNAYTGPGPTGETLNDAGDYLKEFAQDPPYNLPWSDPIRSAGKYVDDYCSGDPKACTNTSNMQSMLNAAFTEITDCTGVSGSTDGTMSDSWSSVPSCQFISSTSWSAWRDWIFIKIADGYQPGGAGSCIPAPDTNATCLIVNGDGHTNTGSGSYHAVVIAASKAMLGKDRSVTSTVSNFLEGSNTDSPTTTSFETYRFPSPSYDAINDMVLCVDGKNKCP